MKIATTSVEMKDTSVKGVMEFTVSKVVCEKPDYRGEAVNSVPQRIEIYKGANRVDAQRIHDEAQAEMYR